MAMPRKRNFDLREFWPWYERAWLTKGGRATPAPFTLKDIASPVPASPLENRLIGIVVIAVAVLAGIGVVWALFYD